MSPPLCVLDETCTGRSEPVRAGVRLGVDVGSVRIGVARSDPGGLLASPLDTVKRGPGDLAALSAIAVENDAIEVIVGLAIGLGGREGKAAAQGRNFADALAAWLAPVPVRLAGRPLGVKRALQQQGSGGLVHLLATSPRVVSALL